MNLNSICLLKLVFLASLGTTALTINAQTSIFIGGGGSMYIKSVPVSVKGHLTNNGTINGTTAGVLTFNGTASQNLDGSAVNTTTIGRINIDNTNGVSLGTNVNVTGTTGLDFTQGALTLNASSIRFPSGSNWTSNTTAKFFITNGLGLVYANRGAAATTYPVGRAAGTASYTPITLTNTGTSDSYGVRVQQDFRTSYNNTDGAAAGTAVTTDAVGVTWVINESVAGSSTLTVTPQWNASDELAGFARTSSMVGYYNYSTSLWTKGALGGVSGANPYTKTLAISTSTIAFLPVAIGGMLSPLPIELLRFEVQRSGNDAMLNWTTATETNNDYFEIERSEDGVNFNKVAIKKGAGNSVSIKNYSLVDLSVSELIAGKIAYYRLKQVDFDGRYSYSPIRFVRFDDKQNQFMYYPNPMDDQLNILYTATDNYNVNITVVNMLGAVVKQVNAPVKKGENAFLLNLSELVNASYSIILTAPDTVIVRKIIVSK